MMTTVSGLEGAREGEGVAGVPLLGFEPPESDLSVVYRCFIYNMQKKEETDMSAIEVEVPSLKENDVGGNGLDELEHYCTFCDLDRHALRAQI